jgi:hypothetical protein
VKEQTGKRRRRPVGKIVFFDDGIEWWIKLKGLLSYRKALALLAIVVALYAGTNLSDATDWIDSLLALLGG